MRHGTLKSLEEVAEDYLEDLTCRSLILVKRKSPGGRMKTCYIHDLMREVCLRESQKQDFFRVINNSGQLPRHDDLLPHVSSRLVSPIHRHNLRRLSFHSSIGSYIGNTYSNIVNTSLPYTRSVMCFGQLTLSDPTSISPLKSQLGMNFRLLKSFGYNAYTSEVGPTRHIWTISVEIPGNHLPRFLVFDIFIHASRSADPHY